MSATVEITFKCGHVEDRDLSAKPAGERRRYAEWLSSTACRSCWQRSSKRTQSKEFKARAEQEVQAALEDQKKMGLPPLAGAEKQVAWGLTSRYNLFRSVYDDLVQSGELSEDEFDERLLTPAKRIDRAGWWIDRWQREPILNAPFQRCEKEESHGHISYFSCSASSRAADHAAPPKCE